MLIFLNPELPGQWQDFKFPDEEFFQPEITKQCATEAEKSSLCAHRASSATEDPICPSSTRDLKLEFHLKPKSKSWSLGRAMALWRTHGKPSAIYKPNVNNTWPKDYPTSSEKGE